MECTKYIFFGFILPFHSFDDFFIFVTITAHYVLIENKPKTIMICTSLPYIISSFDNTLNHFFHSVFFSVYGNYVIYKTHIHYLMTTVYPLPPSF